LLLAGCAELPGTLTPAAPYTCLLSQEQRMLVAELFFGRGIRGRELTAPDGPDFAAQTITPNFPDSFTVFDGGPMAQPADQSYRRRADKIVLVAVKRNLILHDGAACRRLQDEVPQQSVGLSPATRARRSQRSDTFR
jgi:hypothetical protein